jgi:inorganic pyrophosphatase
VSADFWNDLQEMVVNSAVVIDRPKGSAHPRYSDMIYPLDYGYLAETTSSDGQGIDVWMGSSKSHEITGVICTVDLLKCDSEIKICMGCTHAEMQTIKQFLNSRYMGSLLIERQAYEPQDEQVW